MSDWNFIKTRHSIFNTPENIVFNLVKKSTNFDPIKRKKIVKGYDNEVYCVETRQGKEFIVRIRRFGEIGFKQGAWAIEKCRSVGVPVPETVLSDTIKLQGQNFEVMVQNKLPGQSFDKLQDELNKEEIEKVWYRAGQVLGKIHSIRVGGFWRRLPNGKWSLANWERYMYCTIRDRSAEKEFILKAGFNEKDFNFMLSMLKKYKEKFPCSQPVLCHGDFGSGHIFVDENLRISGIIDFGDFQGGPPILDFAYLNFFEPEVDLKPIKKGYPSKELFDDNFDIRLNLQKLPLVMGHLVHNTKIHNIDGVKSNSHALKETLKFLRDIECFPVK